MPKLLKTPFAADAAEGYRTDIQESTGAAPNSATYQVGFPPVTMQSITSNGMPPKGSDLNGVLYDITDNLVFLTQGGGYGFDAAYATSIGGYPLNARLRLTNGDIVKSTIDGNTNDPNVNMTGWFVPYMRGAQNLAELTDVAQARTKLNVYSKADVDTLVGDELLYMPIPYPKSTPPVGYLAMMGQVISQVTYPKLFALYGPALPDMRAYTIRGLDYGRGIDVGRIILSEQGDKIRDITGSFYGIDSNSVAGAAGAFTATTVQSGLTANGSSYHRYKAAFSASNQVPTGAENTVKNISFLYIVKAG